MNGTRLKRDKDQFLKAIRKSIRICDNPQVIKAFPAESSLLDKWSHCRAPVFFDFGEESLLWCLYPAGSLQGHFLAPVRREDFVACHLGDEAQLKRFTGFLQVFGKVISAYAVYLQGQKQIALQRQALAIRPSGFQRYLARQRSRRRL